MRVLQPPGWARPKGYSNGMMAEGRIIVTGGVVGWNERGEFPETLAAQVRQTLTNIATILAEGPALPEHVVRLTWYLVDMDDYRARQKEIGAAYRDIFGSHYPAMAAVQVVRLAEPAAKVEIEATAVVPPV
jgi:enamine deaminase RidA (YjgF/YER057c/UK114 family)